MELNVAINFHGMVRSYFCRASQGWDSMAELAQMCPQCPISKAHLEDGHQPKRMPVPRCHVARLWSSNLGRPMTAISCPVKRSAGALSRHTGVPRQQTLHTYIAVSTFWKLDLGNHWLDSFKTSPSLTTKFLKAEFTTTRKIIFGFIPSNCVRNILSKNPRRQQFAKPL